jgi:DNA-binding HxlR family transcriptional regulator
VSVPADETHSTGVDSGRRELLRYVLGRIGDGWSVIVICRLDTQPRRFNELSGATEGITQRVLTSTLRRSERVGLVSRTVYATVPPQVEYRLTETGRSLHSVLYSLVEWTEAHFAGIQKSRATHELEHSTADNLSRC